MKKITIWIIGVLVLSIIIVFNFIPISISTTNNRYGIIEKQNPMITNLFKDSVQDNLMFQTAFGNKNEQIYIYDYKSIYNLIIWNITGFSDILLKELNIVTNNQFEEIKFNPQSYIEWGDPKVKILSKVDSLSAKKIIIHVDEGCKLKKSKKEPNFLFLDIESNGFAISDIPLDYKLKIEFERKLNYNVCFVNRKRSFQIIILKKNNSDLFFNESLLSMITP